MGQYYKCMIGDPNDYQIPKGINSWSYDNGAKLMEHSYVGNGYVDAAIRLLEMWSSLKEPCRMVWMGDYGDEDLPDIVCENKKNGAKCMFLYHAYCNAWRYIGDEFSPAVDKDDLPLRDLEQRHHSKSGIIIDLDRQEYVRIVDKVVEDDVSTWGQIHPLPLLTAVGCGNGCGDYYGTNSEWVGAWAGDRIVWMEDEDFVESSFVCKLKELNIEFKEKERE